MVNLEVLDLALKWIQENPELHNQGVWARSTPCGTAMCLAGAVVVQNGWTLDFMWGHRGVAEATYAYGPNGQRERIKDVAEDLLGLDNIEGYVLFHYGNTIGDLVRLRNEFAAQNERGAQ